MPAMAANDSWSETLPAAKGFAAKMSARAKHRLVVRSLSLPNTGASRKTESIMPALTAECDEPDMITNAQMSVRHSTDVLRLLPITSCKNATKNDTCMPEMATACASPETPIAEYSASSL